MFELEKYKGMTPQQIHEAHIKDRMEAKATEIRKQFKLEAAVKALGWDEKKAIKLKMLELFGFDRTKPIRLQDMKLRILYFLKLNDLHKNNWVLKYFDKIRQHNR